MKKLPIVIGIGGFARCGKDTFVKIAKNILRKNGYSPFRVAFADPLRDEVQKMLNENNFGLNVHTDIVKEKNKVRPLLVWWGCTRRTFVSDYWIKLAEEKIDLDLGAAGHDYISADKVVILVSDVRFPNEVVWVQDTYEGWVIHIKMYNWGKVKDQYGDNWADKIYTPAPNEEEAKQDPLIQSLVDLKIEWEHKDLAPDKTTDDPYLQGEVLKALNSTPFFNGKLLL